MMYTDSCRKRQDESQTKRDFYQLDTQPQRYRNYAAKSADSAKSADKFQNKVEFDINWDWIVKPHQTAAKTLLNTSKHWFM